MIEEIDVQQVAIDRIKAGGNLFLTGMGGCVDESTQYFTRGGWKDISQWEGEEILSYDKDTGVAFFEDPLDYIKKPCEEFYHTKSRGVDMMLCEDHNILYCPTNNSKAKFIKTEEMVRRHNSSQDGWQGKIKTTFDYSGGGIDLSEGELRLQIAVMADGRVVKEGKDNYTQMRFTKERKYLRLLEMCKKHTLRYEDRGINNQRQYEVIVWAKVRDKKYSWDLLDCSKEQIQIIVDEVVHWDSSLTKEGNIRFSSKFKIDAEVIQFFMASSGKNTSIREDKRKNKESWRSDATLSGKGFRCIANKDRKLKIPIVDSVDGFKYCFTTTTGAFVARRGGCIFTTGNSGKSYVIDQIMDQSTIKCAPYGQAALNIGGMTCHKLFGLPFGIPVDGDRVQISKTMKSVLGNNVVKRIVFDEVGTLRADYLDLINIKLQILKCNNKPFGGLQVVMVGDFFQIDPVVSSHERRMFYEEYRSSFCFDSECWDFETIELHKPYRNTNAKQIKVLESIRRRDNNHRLAVDIINREAIPYDHTKSVLHLCCYKTDAKVVNKVWYSKLEAKENSYKCYNPDKWKETPVDLVIKLKVGCRVIIKANHRDGLYVNGSKGVVSELSIASVTVKLDSGESVQVESNQWDKYVYKTSKGKLEKEIESSFFQLPIALGYAQTVHGAQGATMDDVALDFGEGCFSHGQAYVALSRIRDLKRISLVNPLEYKDIICDSRVTGFYSGL